jgi:uncharacterized repeat protein (TIGR01451 family)
MKSKKQILVLLSSLCLVALVLGSSQIMPAQADTQLDLEITLKAPQHVAPGSNPVINLSYSNIGTAGSPADTRIQVVLPEGLGFVSAVDQDGNPLPPASIDGNVLTWMVGVLPASSCCAHIWITTLVDNDLPEETLLTTTAEISSEAPENNLTNNQASVTSQVCDMGDSKKEVDKEQAKPGDVLTYTITLRLAQRQGLDEMRGRSVIVTDQLPPAEQAHFLGWVGEPAGTVNGQQLRWQGFVGMNEPVTLRYRLGIEGDLPPGEQVTNRARLQWSGGEMDLEPVDVLIDLTDDDHMFGPGGGQWEHAWGMTLTVPPNAVTEMTRFQFRPLIEDSPDTPPGWVFAHRAFELTAFQFGEIHRFNQPVNIMIRYNQGEINGILPNTLRLWYRAGPDEPWMMVGDPLQNGNGQISFNTDHFTEFALFGRAGFEVMLPMLVR